MDLITAAIIAVIFLALILSVFMVAYRYNSMSAELKGVNGQLRKLARAQAELMAPLDRLISKSESLGAAVQTPVADALSSTGNSAELKSIRTDVQEVLARLEALDQLMEERTATWAHGGGMPTIPPQRTAQPAEEAASSEWPQASSEKLPPFLKRTEKKRVEEPAPPPPRPPAVPERNVTPVRCPNCSRQLPYDALKMQDEQICPYCDAVFRSNDYLLSLITEGEVNPRIPRKSNND